MAQIPADISVEAFDEAGWGLEGLRDPGEVLAAYCKMHHQVLQGGQVPSPLSFVGEGGLSAWGWSATHLRLRLSRLEEAPRFLVLDGSSSAHTHTLLNNTQPLSSNTGRLLQEAPRFLVLDAAGVPLGNRREYRTASSE